MLKLVEFCTGTGAFSLAFEKTKKVKTVFSNDYEKNSEKIFNKNFKTEMKCCDIHQLKVEDIPSHDILSAGFPCQPFSLAGNKKGFNDERSNVFWKLIKILEYHQSPIIVFENVKNLVSHDKGKTFKKIKEELEKLKYFLKIQVLNTCNVTKIPQNRERLFIIGFKNKEYCDRFSFPKNITTFDNISNYLEKSIDNKYYYTNKLKVWNTVKSEVTKNISDNVVYQYRRYYVRENKNSVCPTLTANMGSGGHNVPLIKDDKGIRKLTPRECFNLQGFPTKYKFPKMSDSALYKLAGNAVSVPVVELIAKNIIKSLKERENTVKSKENKTQLVELDV